MTSGNKAQTGFRTDVMIGEDANYLIDRESAVTRSDNSESNDATGLSEDGDSGRSSKSLCPSD